MNSATVYIVLLAILFVIGCDTKDNVKPRNENFFVKMYNGVLPGDQFGVDIIETSDGGLLIAGTGMNDDGSEEMLLIKTDAKGDEQWKRGSISDYNWTSNGRSKSLLELADGSGYILGGTLGSGNQRRSVLLKVDPSGGLIDSTMLRTKTATQEFFNQLSKISITGNLIVVCGETGLIESGTGNGVNGFIGIINTDLTNPTYGPVGPSSFRVRYFGIDGDEIMAGGFEVSDVLKYGVNGTRYLAFGSAINSLGNERDIFCVELDSVLTILADVESGFKDINGIAGNQIPNNVSRLGDNYLIIGQTDNPGLQIYLERWKDFDWSASQNDGVGNTTGVQGTGVAFRSPVDHVIVGDKIIDQGVHHEIFLAQVDLFQFVDSPWPRQFGTTTSTYSSSAVSVLQDGSIVIVGTADLDPIKKIVVIKTGPKGEMSF